MKKAQTTLASLAMAMAMLPNAATAQIPHSTAWWYPQTTRHAPGYGRCQKSRAANGP